MQEPGVSLADPRTARPGLARECPGWGARGVIQRPCGTHGHHRWAPTPTVS